MEVEKKRGKRKKVAGVVFVAAITAVVVVVAIAVVVAAVYSAGYLTQLLVWTVKRLLVREGNGPKKDRHSCNPRNRLQKLLWLRQEIEKWKIQSKCVVSPSITVEDIHDSCEYTQRM